MRLNLSLLAILERTCSSVELDAQASPFKRLLGDELCLQGVRSKKGRGLCWLQIKMPGCAESDKGRLDQDRALLAVAPFALRHCQSLGMLKAIQPTDQIIRR